MSRGMKDSAYWKATDGLGEEWKERLEAQTGKVYIVDGRRNIGIDLCDGSEEYTCMCTHTYTNLLKGQKFCIEGSQKKEPK